MSGYDPRVKTKTMHSIDAFELESLIQEHYPTIPDYCFQASEECGNDEARTYYVREEALNEYDRERIEGGDYVYRTASILDDLCAKAVIPEGEYVVELSY